MPNARDALLEMEVAQTPIQFSELDNSGDSRTFASSDDLWSRRTGFEPVVRPDGLVNGGIVSPTTINNQVSVTAALAFLAGAELNVPSSLSLAVTRAVTDTHIVHSITINQAGAYEVVGGAEGTAFSEVRGAAGGPALIPVGSIEVAQVRLASSVASPVLATEIFSAPGLHTERFDSPAFTTDFVNGRVSFPAPLPAIHVGQLPKRVYASYSIPVFSQIPNARNFKAPYLSFSVSSDEFYQTTLGSTSSTLNQGSFETALNTGIQDQINQLAGENLWFRFRPSRFRSELHVTQGILGVDRTFPADALITAACTISPEQIGSDRAS